MTALLTTVSLLLVVAIVLIVAWHLIGIYLALKRAADHLQQLAGGLIKVRDDTSGLNDKVNTINGGLGALVPPLLGANNNLAAIVKVATSG
jgi:hypothetical protein